MKKTLILLLASAMIAGAQARSVVAFDGVLGQYVNIKGGHSYSLGPEMSMGGWVKNPRAGTRGWELYHYGVLFGQGGIGTGAGFVVYIVEVNGAISIETQVRQGDPAYMVNCPFSEIGLQTDDDRWHYVMTTVSAANGRLRLYLDGKLIGELANQNFPDFYSGATQNFTIGANSNGEYPYKGSMAEVAFWNRELSEFEAAKLAEHLVNPEDEGLVSYWPLDEAEGEDARNLAPNGLTGYYGTTRVEDSGLDIPSYAEWLENRGDGTTLVVKLRSIDLKEGGSATVHYELVGTEDAEVETFAVISPAGIDAPRTNRIMTCENGDDVYLGELHGLLPRRVYDVFLFAKCGEKEAVSSTNTITMLDFATAAFGEERSIAVEKVIRDERGIAESVRLAIGAGEGASALYVAYGAVPGGELIASWEHSLRVASVDSAATEITCELPSLMKWGEESFAMRFFLCDEVEKAYDRLYDSISSSISSRQQYLVTDYYPNPDTELVMDVSFTDFLGGADKNTIFFGTAEPVEGNPNTWLSYAFNFASHSYDCVYGWFGYAYGHGQADDLRSIASGISEVSTTRNTIMVKDGLLTWGSKSLAIHTMKGRFVRNPLHVFGYIDGDGSIRVFDCASMTLYSMKIYEKGNLLHDYHPASKDGRAGLYDAAQGVMLMSAGTDDFALGEQIEDTLDDAIVTKSGTETILFDSSSAPFVASIELAVTENAGELIISGTLDDDYAVDGVEVAVLVGEMNCSAEVDGSEWSATLEGLAVNESVKGRVVAIAPSGLGDVVVTDSIYLPGKTVFGQITTVATMVTNTVGTVEITHIGLGTTCVKLMTQKASGEFVPVEGAEWLLTREDGESKVLEVPISCDWNSQLTWKLVATGEINGEAYQVETDQRLIETYDYAWQYWRSDVDEGEWNDPANWTGEDNAPRDSLPGLYSKVQTRVGPGRHVKISIDGTVKVSELWMNNPGATIEFVGLSDTNYLDANTIINTPMAGTTFIYDNVRTWVYQYAPENDGIIELRGAKPGIDMHHSAFLTNGDIVFKLLVPADGYETTPIIAYAGVGVTGAGLFSFADDRSTMTAKFIVRVPAESPIAKTQGRKRVQLVSAMITEEMKPYIVCEGPNRESTFEITEDGIYLNYAKNGLIVTVR